MWIYYLQSSVYIHRSGIISTVLTRVYDHIYLSILKNSAAIIEIDIFWFVMVQVNTTIQPYVSKKSHEIKLITKNGLQRKTTYTWALEVVPISMDGHSPAVNRSDLSAAPQARRCAGVLSPAARRDCAASGKGSHETWWCNRAMAFN